MLGEWIRIMKKPHIICVFLAVFLLFVGCGTKTADEDDPGIFAGEEIALAENWHPLVSVSPYVGEGTITVFCSNGEEYALFSLDSGAESPRWARVEGDFPIAVSPMGGAVTQNAVFLVEAGDGTEFAHFRLIRYAYGGAEEKDVSLESLFGALDSTHFGIQAVAAMGDTVCALAAGEKIVCVDAELNRSFSVTCGGEALGLAFDPAGDLMALFPGEDCFRLLDGRTGAVKKTIPGAGRARTLFSTGKGELCFADASGVKLLSETGEHSLLLDYLNSNLTAQTAALLGVVDKDTAVIVRNGGGESVVCLYRRSGKSADPDCKTFEIALTGDPSPLLSDTIVRFNASRPDVRVLITNYGEYATADDWQAGQRRLALDLTTGVYKPDLIYAPASDIEMQAAVRHRLYIDLMPFVERDRTLNLSTLFGAAVRAAGDGEGGMWGIPESLEVNSLFSTRTILEKYGIADGILPEEGMLAKRAWTVDEMLDFLEALPDGVLPIFNLTAENAAYYLLGKDGFGAFIDYETMTCDFTDPTAVRFFRYLLSLPRNYDELQRTSAYWQTDERDVAARNEFFFDGRIALRMQSFSSMMDFATLEVLFNAKDYVALGQPTSGDYQVNVQPLRSFLVTTYCSDPASAWDFIRMYMTTPLTDGKWGDIKYHLFFPPSYKPAFREIAEYEKTMTIIYTYSGGMRTGNSPDLPQTTEELREPGIVFHLTDGDIAAAEDLLDKVGKPWILTVDDEVRAIIDEEISDMLGGVTTPEKCAERVQSRVSLWLAEHK